MLRCPQKRVNSNVGRQDALAERLDQVGRRAGAELVARRVEGRGVALAVGAHRLNERHLGPNQLCHVP